jgi:Nuclease-related domain
MIRSGARRAETWGKGSAGESKLASFIARELGERVIALHDRLIPGTKRNVDHIFVAPTGVWVVDAKSYTGRVVKKDVGPIWRGENKVYVGSRDRTKLAKGVESQVEVVLAALQLDPACKGTLVYGALCFVGSDWGLLDFPFQVGSVWVLYPGALRKRLRKNGPLSREAMERAARAIALGLPAATSQ